MLGGIKTYEDSRMAEVLAMPHPEPGDYAGVIGRKGLIVEALPGVGLGHMVDAWLMYLGVSEIVGQRRKEFLLPEKIDRTVGPFEGSAEYPLQSHIYGYPEDMRPAWRVLFYEMSLATPSLLRLRQFAKAHIIEDLGETLKGTNTRPEHAPDFFHTNHMLMQRLKEIEAHYGHLPWLVRAVGSRVMEMDLRIMRAEAWQAGQGLIASGSNHSEQERIKAAVDPTNDLRGAAVSFAMRAVLGRWGDVPSGFLRTDEARAA